ncbi:tetratricopeptide repeat protein [Haloferula sp. A504]|uniref:tetratricopeptide repeat protein n=1 Tax=Haloferula sp. A504 TaxID=3373601 RepID=UPI0031C1113F|nr:tetratricopeptide repeat protein [Verrucomicrobiaceae bacterium E54]
MKTFVFIGVHSWFLSAALISAPLDDRIAAFEDAATQTEGSVAEILKSGLAENRSALAFAAVKPWLAANPGLSNDTLFQAARSAERAGEWSSAASFYRKLLTDPKVDGRIAGEAVPATYRLLINHLGDPEAAYLFMREDGARLRTFGRARQFDRWFLDRARERKDLVALARWHAAILNSNDPLDRFEDSLEFLMSEFETFSHESERLYEELDALASARRTPAGIKERIAWAKTIIPLCKPAAELAGAKKPIPEDHFNSALPVAEAMIAAAPFEGSRAAMIGWMNFNAGDSGVFNSFVTPGREAKAAPILKTLRQLPPQQAQALLQMTVDQARGRKVADYMFSKDELRALVKDLPQVFNSLAAPDVPLFDATLTPEVAKEIAPHLARNPHAQAAMVRAWARPERRYSAAADQMMKSEMWRFDDIKTLTHGLWHSGMFEREGEDHNAPNVKYNNLDSRYQKLKQQVSKEAKNNERLAAFKTLQADLLSANPSTPGALPLWDALFAQAPDADREVMLIRLVADEDDTRSSLFRRAIEQSSFGGSTYARLRFGPGFDESWDRWGKKQAREALPEFAKHLQQILTRQAQAGKLSERILGLWLHSVDPEKPESREAMKALFESSAYAAVDPAYHSLAAREQIFGPGFLTTQCGSADPRFVSRDLLALPQDATPAQVESALKSAVEGAANAPDTVTVIGLEPVAKLPEWSPETRSLVLSLFSVNSPVAPPPSRQGYEPLVQRIADEARESSGWSPLEPYAAGLWHAAAATDDGRHYRGADALARLAEAANQAGSPSVAMTVARSGRRSVAGRALANAGDGRPSEIAGLLRQVAGKAAMEVGAVEIPVAENDPSYPIYKSNAEFVQDNRDTAWVLYDAHADQLKEVLRSLSVGYGLWLLERNIEEEHEERAEELVKELTIWSRQAAGTFSPEQDAALKIAYAELAFRKGALPTARAWFRKVADAAEYEGTSMHLEAALGSVKVDRVSRNFGAALTELDNLMRLPNPEFRKRVRYARAEVLMDQENFAEALDELEAVLRVDPKHPDALILRGQIHYQMRKLVEASEIELGPSQDDTVIVPGEAVKINLRDPTLRVSGVGADIEVEIWAKSGDKVRVLLYQLGDSKDKFRAEVPTELGAPNPNDKVLQVLGVDEIRFGYSERFRKKMDDLPDDPDLVITVASDAMVDFSAGAFPPRQGERRLDIEELGLSTAQAALGTRAVRPGNPVYLRVTDPDRSASPGIDEITVSMQASSGDEIRQLVLKETAPFSGEFQAIVPTTGAQALAFASESAPGRDPNMAISALDYPGWQGQVGDREATRIFGVDLNDNVGVARMTVASGGTGQQPTHFVFQTSMNGDQWTTRARFPDDEAPWNGKPQMTSFPTFREGIPVSEPEGSDLPEDWLEKMELGSVRPNCNYLAAYVPDLAADGELPVVNTGHPGYSGLIRYRALFYQPAAAIRRFQLTGLPRTDDKGVIRTIFLLNGEPADEESEDPLLIERELAPGLHEIEFWCHDGRDKFLKRKPALLCDEPGKAELVPCPPSMFDPATFPEGVRAAITQPATITSGDEGFTIDFGDKTQARMVRLVIEGFEGVTPAITKVTLTDRDDNQLLPVAQDYKALRENMQLEVLPGDQIVARYEDPVTATPNRDRHQRSLGVAYNTGTITASFLNYETNKEGERELVLEPIRRFRMDDAVAIVIEDADLDGSPERDTIEFVVNSSSGASVTLKAVETEKHSGVFMGRVFPVEGEPSRDSEIQLTPGGVLTAVYRDVENLDPGIPADREVTITHAQYELPLLSAYALSSEVLPYTPTPSEDDEKARRPGGTEVFHPRSELSYHHVDSADTVDKPLTAVIGANLRFDVVAPHLALAGSSEIRAYVQTDEARKAAKAPGKEFDVTVPGTLKLTGRLGSGELDVPRGYHIATPPTPPTNEPPLEQGRFSFSIPLILGDPPTRSFATKSAEELPSSAIPDGLAVKAGDIVHVGFPWQDQDGKVHWKTTRFTVGSDAFLDVMENGYREALTSAYVGEKIYLRLLAPGLDRGPERDNAIVTLKGTSGASTRYEVRETESHSGVFKGVFTVAYADEQIPAELPPVALNGFPVRYGDDITVSYEDQSFAVNVNKGADGVIEPFSKRFTGDEMAVRTGFTLAECYFELAKKHREMDEESLARRQIGQARKLLAEALATHRDDELKAHAEYLLGNLSQEFADLAKNDESKLPMYQDALARFSKIPTDYPDTEFAPKAQFKTALVYEKMGEIENSVEEYVKLAYKYPNDELIPTVMARLGGYFQKKGQEFKEQADLLRENEDDESKAEVLRLDDLSYPEFLNAAMVFSKLQERFPDDPLAGLAGLRAAQNFMRAHQYEEALVQFQQVIDSEQYDGPDIRAQAIYWSGISHERWVGLMSENNYKARGNGIREAYQLYRRVTFDFPDSKWAKYARGRLADPVFARIIEEENKARERMIEQLKESR